MAGGSPKQQQQQALLILVGVALAAIATAALTAWGCAIVAAWVHSGQLPRLPLGDAQELTAPLLHAAALSPGKTIVDVYRWVRDRDVRTPAQILTQADAEDPCARQQAVYGLNDRRRDAVIGAVQVQLKAYGHPAVARTARRGSGITPEDLSDGPANTSTSSPAASTSGCSLRSR